MGVFAVTGSASGIGAATVRLLTREGYRVIGIDLTDSDITADLGTVEGRTAAIAGVTETCDGALDGLVTAAGIGPSSIEPGGRLISINYFGTVELIAGLRGVLAAAGSSAVVALSSNSSTCQPDWPVEYAEACLAGDEAAAVALADQQTSLYAYPASKTAVAWWIREHAADWAGDGIRLNAIAPGLIETPMTAGQRVDPLIGQLIDAFPVPRGHAGQPEEVAAVIAFMLSPAASLLHGSVLFADGGTDASLRARDWPAAWNVSDPRRTP
ncbi:SDR family oxidoreductase [Aeromicrobium sp.]|uniref:SDR family oxidoreductase n=1 Tax=Aeromicrobium sp. TaxID=1871063 RepID=UPI002FCB59B7